MCCGEQLAQPMGVEFAPALIVASSFCCPPPANYTVFHVNYSAEIPSSSSHVLGALDSHLPWHKIL